MQKLFCAITGDKYTWVIMDTPESQKKIQALAIAVLVPTLLWLLNGFLLSYKVLQVGVVPSMGVGVGCALVIFIVEKLVVMSPKGRWIGALRISMGAGIAFIGSLAIDEAFFHDDITNQVGVVKSAHLARIQDTARQQFARQHELDSVKRDVKEKYTAWNEGIALTVKEVDGLSGGQSGYGGKARYKNGVAGEKKVQYAAAKAKLDTLLAQQARFVDSVGKEAASTFNPDGLLVRLQAMFTLIEDNFYVRAVYLVFTSVFFCFELIAIIFKLSWKKTNYERKLGLIEQLGERRLESLYQHHTLQDPAYDYAKAQLRRTEKVSYSPFKP